MPRPPRLQFQDASYHIFSRGNRREAIFRTPEDYQTFESFMLEAMRRSGVQLFDWSLMPNHFHFNVATPDGNVAEFLHRLLTRYAKYFNAAHRLVGHLFQGRYGSRLVDRDAYFQEMIRYVELNPYRVKGRPLAPLGKWRWASLHYLLQPESAWPENCQPAFRRVLESFSQDAGKARQLLLQFLADGLATLTWEDFYQPKSGRFIGNDAFVERIKGIVEEPIRSKLRPIPPTSLDALLSHTADISGLEIAALAAAGKGRRASRWRQAVMAIAWESLGRSQDALKFREELLFLFLTDENGVHPQTKNIRDFGDAVHAGLMEATVPQISPDVLLGSPNSLGQVLIGPSFVFQGVQNLHFELEQLVARLKLLPDLGIFQLFVKHAFHNRSPPSLD